MGSQSGGIGYFVPAQWLSSFSVHVQWITGFHVAAIGVPMAIEIGCDPMPVAMACVFGCSLAMATPMATTSITMVQVAGYRFKDYLRIGGLIGLISVATTWISIVLLYGLL